MFLYIAVQEKWEGTCTAGAYIIMRRPLVGSYAPGVQGYDS